MQYKFFAIPVVGECVSEIESELNSFLRGHRVLSVTRELVSQSSGSMWCLCVEYLETLGGRTESASSAWEKKERVDYRDILSEEAFSRFRVMREIRKAIAETDIYFATVGMLALSVIARARNKRPSAFFSRLAAYLILASCAASFGGGLQ